MHSYLDAWARLSCRKLQLFTPHQREYPRRTYHSPYSHPRQEHAMSDTSRRAITQVPPTGSSRAVLCTAHAPASQDGREEKANTNSSTLPYLRSQRVAAPQSWQPKCPKAVEARLWHRAEGVVSSGRCCVALLPRTLPAHDPAVQRRQQHPGQCRSTLFIPPCRLFYAGDGPLSYVNATLSRLMFNYPCTAMLWHSELR